jgi:hypothetical protein
MSGQAIENQSLRQLLPFNPSNGQVPIWNSTTNRWEAGSNGAFDPTANYNVTGSWTFTQKIIANDGLEMAYQAAPTGVAGKTTLYADATGKLAWRNGTGFTRTFDASTITVNRTYTLPDNDVTLLGVSAPIDTTLRSVVAGGTSPLQLSTTQVAIGGVSSPVFLFNGTNPAGAARNWAIALGQSYNGAFEISYGSANGTSGLANVALTINNAGSVGIGFATSASARLHVRGDGTNPIARFENSAVSRVLTLSQATDHIGLEFTGGAYIRQYSLQRIDFANYYDFYDDISSASQYGFNYILKTRNYTSGTAGGININGAFGAASGSGNYRHTNIAYTINNSGTVGGTATGIFLNATETALNGMTHNLMDLQVGGVSRFRVGNNGSVTAALHITTAGDFVTTNTGGQFKISDTKLGRGGADGTFVMLNNAENGFNRLMLGGTTSSFPAIKRNGAAIDFRLADDSGFCAVNTGAIATIGNINVTGSIICSSNQELGANGYFAFGSRTMIRSSVDGILTLTNYAQNDFNRLQLGGTTSSFPSIARSTTNLVICLADATAGAGLGVGMASATGIVASAILQADSKTKGFLPPRMNSGEKNAIAAPAQGLVVFDTDLGKLCVYNATWETLTSL